MDFKPPKIECVYLNKKRMKKEAVTSSWRRGTPEFHGSARNYITYKPLHWVLSTRAQGIFRLILLLRAVVTLCATLFLSQPDRQKLPLHGVCKPVVTYRYNYVMRWRMINPRLTNERELRTGPQHPRWRYANGGLAKRWPLRGFPAFANEHVSNEWLCSVGHVLGTAA